MRPGFRLAGLYALFAIIATLLNLGAQRVILGFGETPLLFGLAIVTGTGVGLVVKYVLDKRWIFADRTTGIAGHGQRFGLYTATGIITTAIFWGMETAFWLVWGTEMMRELGAVLGLSIGYIVKYFLDRRFVFADLPSQSGIRI